MATRMRVPVLAIPALCVLAACDAGIDEAAPAVDREGGVEVVRHGMLADYGRPVFAVEPLLAIGGNGAEDGPPEFAFGEVAGLDVMADGTIAVLDGQAGEVRTFAPDGSFLRRIGRKGEGPGEISGEGTLALVAVSATSFLVPDIMTQTLNVYSLGGEVVVSRRFDIQEMYIPEWRTSGDALPVVRVSSPGGEVVARYAVFSAEESLRDTLAAVARPAEPEAASRRQPLWQDHLVWSFSEDVGDDLVLVQRIRPVEKMDLRVIYTFKAAGFGGRMWDAFSFGGEYLGALDLGAPADVFDIRGDTIFGVREDDAGVQQVFLARLPGELGAER